VAITPTDQADITANGLYVGSVANKTAFAASNLLRSGFMSDASAVGTLSPVANKVSFPVWDFTNVVSATLPADGSALTNVGNATYSFVDETCDKVIVSTQAVESAILTGVGGPTGYLDQLGKRVGNCLATSIENSAYAKAKALAVAASQVVDADTDNINYDVIVQAASQKWGAHWRPGNCAIVMHSLVHGYLLQDEDFKRAMTSSKADLAGNPLSFFAGMQIIISDAVTATGSGATAVYDNLLITRDCLKVFMNGDVRMKKVHIPGSDTDAYDAIYSFATHASRDYPTGAIVLQTLATTPTP